MLKRAGFSALHLSLFCINPVPRGDALAKAPRNASRASRQPSCPDRNCAIASERSGAGRAAPTSAARSSSSSADTAVAAVILLSNFDKTDPSSRHSRQQALVGQGEFEVKMRAMSLDSADVDRVNLVNRRRNRLSWAVGWTGAIGAQAIVGLRTEEVGMNIPAFVLGTMGANDS